MLAAAASRAPADPLLAGLYELAKLTRTAAQGHLPWGASVRR